MSTLGRWRLVLGKGAEAEGLPSPSLSAESRADDLLNFLFDGQPSNAGEGDSAAGATGRSSRKGGRGGPTFEVPAWVEGVRELFPTSAKEVLERELLHRRGLAALLQEPRLLERLEPNLELTRLLLSHRSLLNEHTRPMARRLIEKVVGEIRQRLKIAVEQVLAGALRRDRHSPRPSFHNLDVRRTIRRNLQHYDAAHERLLVERIYYFQAERKQRPWHLVVVVDQSGSMLESVVFSAIMASIFAALPALRTSLVVFADGVADLTDKVHDPVDVLMSAQLGGGTNITGALEYASGLIRLPQRTILVLISDFEEGADPPALLQKVKLMAESGVRLIGLGALSYEGRPTYSQEMARDLRKRGMDVLCCTPEHLAECVARIIRG